MAAAALTGLSPAALGPSCDAPAPPASLATAPSVFLDALVRCSKRQRCSVLQHGVTPSSEGLFAALPTVAFFVVEPDETAAKRLVLSLAARNASHVHVLAAPLDRVGAAPMRNAVLNPGGARRLTALQALQTSNEFFDLQLVHAAVAPSAAVARSLLALAPATLLLLPTAAAAAAWRAAVAALPATPPRADDAVGAAVELAAEAFDGCAAAGCAARAGAAALDDGAAHTASLVQLTRLRRLSAHHLSCWAAPRCHSRMYVSELPAAPPLRDQLAGGDVGDDGDGDDDGDLEAAAADGGGGVAPWRRRLPRMYRVEVATPGGGGGGAAVDSLASAWAARGKRIPFETGGVNLDSLVALGLHGRQRAALAAGFLRLRVGRDMMLWNIVAGARGPYAIDQEGEVYAEPDVPWERRAMPYCFTVRDCYEKALHALCAARPFYIGKPAPAAGELEACLAAMPGAPCADVDAPFACAEGCRAGYRECRRG